MAEHSEQQERNFSFFTHKACEYFPCHSGIEPENFNCLFCYCPLYALGKDCSGCTIPHKKENYGYVTEHFEQILRLIQQKE